jgi:hypothetical protein
MAMSHSVEIRSEEASFNLTIPDELREIYIDGASTVALGYPLSKLLLHSIVPPADVGKPDQVEERKAILRLVVPTGVLVELAINILKAASGHKAPLAAAATTADAQFAMLISQLPDPMTAEDRSQPG